MAELLDWDGVWSEELIMLAAATLGEIEADEMLRQQSATTAAIAAAFSKGGSKVFTEAMDSAREKSRASRSEDGKRKGSSGSVALMQELKKVGIDVRALGAGKRRK